MAAHDSTEYKGRSQEYLDLIVEQMLPKWRKKKLVEFCDISEKGVFTADESRYLLSRAKEMGQAADPCGWDQSIVVLTWRLNWTN